MTLRIDAERFREWTRLCAESLAVARDEIDALNVFPVPDADTGTNARMTTFPTASHSSMVAPTSVPAA